ncbi:MAG: hypothetical protein ACLFWB_08755 [Armatimonadota bacterium]
MKRTLTIAGVITALVISVIIAGCGRAKDAADSARQAAEDAKEAAEATRASKELQEKGETTIETPEGKVEVKKGGKSAEWTGEDEDGTKTTASTTGEADISDLQIAVYPGAKQQKVMTESKSDGEYMAVEFSTDDSFEKVSEFYETEYPDFDKSTMTRDGRKLLVLKSQTESMNRTIAVVKEADEDAVIITMEQTIKNTE